MTVAEILKQSGMTDADIAALDQRVMAGVTTVVNSATQLEAKAAQDRAAAELADRAQKQLYSEKIAPALNEWGNEKVTLEAQLAFYKTQAEAAKVAGFIAKDAPGYVAPAGAGAGGDPGRGGDGRYVPNGGGVPGSPAFMTKEQGMAAVSNATWVISEHMRLHGAPAPDDIETLAREADAQRMPFRDWASKKYNFEGRKAEIVATKQREHDDAIRKETEAARDKYWSEQRSSNPMVRPGEESHFSKLRAGIDAKKLKDPLMMSKAERHAQTSQLINTDIAENASASVH